ncbi:hypothetical protein F3Y22_tig00112236pilonHSYRG00065 [Hibiscus syriacus]|uniref:C2H2-type domain-containing protein n=1 Tax=Hibiscus syriacus TaxID=106335 RepID=A0A6A2Y238_HIBSY|nr:uncharacterized protein LOC120176366 [Hibiscus syriacus]KAE8669446.1 hypothetical protein F3Y22_tig00112236pilonHSYRG00065 [Hibiscus syriacus]
MEAYQNQNKWRHKIDKPPSWAVLKRLFFGKQRRRKQQEQVEQEPLQQKKKMMKKQKQQLEQETGKKCKKMRCSGSICSNTKVIQRPEVASPEVHKKRASFATTDDASTRSMKAPLRELNGLPVSSSNSSLLSVSSTAPASSVGGSFGGMPFGRFSGCYECKMVVDPLLGISKDPSFRGAICSCPDCGEIFMKAENLELHQAVRHAVSELGHEDTSKNIVEIIFQSSWLKKQTPICQIDRVLKVHNTPKTISRFEEYRDSIKSKATKLPKKLPRCIADGNELLRFHCTTFACSLGDSGSTNLCNAIPKCNVCSIIKNGFKVAQETDGKGILTTATSGKAHDKAIGVEDEGCEKRAMLVCRVIAGKVKKNMDGNIEDYDSVAGDVGVYSDLDELFVFNPRAILPCFVVIYGGF